jgi:hypothetical protein
MWRCLYSSLTEEAKATLLTYKKDYEIMVNGQPKVGKCHSHCPQI